MAEAEIRDVALIGKHAEYSWQAAAWRLERKFPAKWGRKQIVDNIEEEGMVVNIIPLKPIDDTGVE